MNNEFHIDPAAAGSALAGALTAEDFANLGGGHIAYLRTIRSEEAAELFPQAHLSPGLTLFTLHAADGTPIMLTDSREAAIANAMQNELVTLSVH
ncbi:hypothetical protein EV667_0069 [Ancylobacter aquaticus]|uniref:DUF1150 domain-containing protein n=1 Tax=Ancylobacter aquaticus TaxID=100 RepID=A0A4R1I3W2_ANCAQ|nr:DUF1150 domain-containing protein [Ancylobacter aquaticus]TCK29984.1 hypothetical protein EV667_0069 [Ancylobacter aquaticus]